MLAQASAEQWQQLALRGPDHVEPSRLDGESQRFYLREPIGGRLLQVLGLTRLTSLDVSGNAIGDEGARALAALPRMTDLNLDGNRIGAAGAWALLEAGSTVPVWHR